MFRIAVIVFIAIHWCCAFTDSQADDQFDAKISQWIKELGHSEFSVRAKAQQRLEGSGVEAMTQLENAARGEDVQVRMGARAALRNLYNSSDGELSAAAEAAIKRSSSKDEFEHVSCKHALRILEKHKPSYSYNNKKVVKLSLGSPTDHVSLSPDDFRILPYFRSLKTLNLSGTNTTDDDLSHVAKLPNLVVLYLEGHRSHGRRSEAPEGFVITEGNCVD